MLICVACIFTPADIMARRGEAHAFREHKAAARRVRHEPGGAGSKAGGSAANRKQMGARHVGAGRGYGGAAGGAVRRAGQRAAGARRRRTRPPTSPQSWRGVNSLLAEKAAAERTASIISRRRGAIIALCFLALVLALAVDAPVLSLALISLCLATALFNALAQPGTAHGPRPSPRPARCQGDHDF